MLNDRLPATDVVAKPRKPRTRMLGRGKACFSCRHLKIKCDGIRPICGPCTRGGKDDTCEFPDTNSRTTELVNTVQDLQARIKELESGMDQATIADPFNTPSSMSLFSSRSSPQSDPGDVFLGDEEPPLFVIEMLLDAFLPHATQFGFFLHIEHFRQSAILPFHFGDPRRPTPALLSAVYLWGAHLSHAHSASAAEPAFLRRAREHIASEASDSPNINIIQTIQAQVLFAMYMIRNKRFVDAETHSSGAMALVLGAHLHQIRYAHPSQPLPLLGSSVLEGDGHLPPARSALEEGERVRAFWSAVGVQVTLYMTLCATGNPPILDSPNIEIYTPWPMDIADYERAEWPPVDYGEAPKKTLTSFLKGEGGAAGNGSLSALGAQAQVLLHRALRLGTKWSPNLSPAEITSYTDSYHWLHARIDAFWNALPPLHPLLSPEDEPGRLLVLIHATTAAASVKLHRVPGSVDAGARARCLSAARTQIACLSTATTFPSSGGVLLPPMAGSIGVLANRVIMDEVRLAQRFRGEWSGAIMGVGGSVVPPGGEEVGLTADLRRGVEVMRGVAGGTALQEYQLGMLKAQYEGLLLSNLSAPVPLQNPGLDSRMFDFVGGGEFVGSCSG